FGVRTCLVSSGVIFFPLRLGPHPQPLRCFAVRYAHSLAESSLLGPHPHALVSGRSAPSLRSGLRDVAESSFLLQHHVTAGERGCASRAKTLDKFSCIVGILALVPVVVDAHDRRLVAGAEALD